MALRWMTFVDGENFTIRGPKVAGAAGVRLQGPDLWQKDRFLWANSPTSPGTVLPHTAHRLSRSAWYYRFARPSGMEQDCFRATYYTGVPHSAVDETTERLLKIGFLPKVFVKARNRASKAVDIALATDMLTHTFRRNFDVAVLVAGDGDYLPLVQEVQRLGKRVQVAFFAENGLSDDLRRAADDFFDMTDAFLRGWRAHLHWLEQQSH